MTGDWEFSRIGQGRGAPPLSPPEAKAVVTHLACQKPDERIAVPEWPGPKLAGELAEAKLLNKDQSGQLWLTVPVSRFSAAIIAWLLVVLGIVKSVSTQTVSRWLKNERLKPWQFRSWITPRNLESFLPRARDVLELYQRIRFLKNHEIVWSGDEKTSIQARERESQKPSSPGHPAHVENTYIRQGAAQLLAALNVATGKVLGIVRSGKAFAQFQELIYEIVEESLRQGKTLIHLVLDNGSTHRPKYLERWLEQEFTNVRFQVHWLPVHSSWLNQIEIYFSRLQSGALTPNNFASLDELSKRILGFIALTNLDPVPIKWTYTAFQLFRKYGREVLRVW